MVILQTWIRLTCLLYKDYRKTYDITDAKEVWAQKGQPGLEKRQATMQLTVFANGIDSAWRTTIFNPEKAGGSILPPSPLYGFSKNVPCKETLKLWFSLTFNIIISHMFPENFIEIPQVDQKI